MTTTPDSDPARERSTDGPNRRTIGPPRVPSARSTGQDSGVLGPRDRRLWLAILGASAAVTAFLIWWIYYKTTGQSDAAWIDALPALNATFNTLAALSMTAGFLAIRSHRIALHKRLMLTAVGFSAAFLVSYLLYHHYHGDTPFGGEGWARTAYFALLISHVVLSILMLPMILGTLTFAFRGRFANHRKIARITLPTWLYVSVTGVIIFFVLSATSI